MEERRYRTAVSFTCGDSLRRFCIIWILSLFIIMLGIVVIILETVPLARDGEIYGIKRITTDLSSIVKPILSHQIRNAKATALILHRKLPAWIPLWSINKPIGVIDRRLPPINELAQDAHHLLPILDHLKEHKFFRIFKVRFHPRGIGYFL